MSLYEQDSRNNFDKYLSKINDSVATTLMSKNSWTKKHGELELFALQVTLIQANYAVERDNDESNWIRYSAQSLSYKLSNKIIRLQQQQKQ